MNRNTFKVYKNDFSIIMKFSDFLIFNIVYITLLFVNRQDVFIIDVAISLIMSFFFLNVGSISGLYKQSIRAKKIAIILTLTFNVFALWMVMFLLGKALHSVNGMDEVLAKKNIVHLEYLGSFVAILIVRLALSNIKVPHPRIAILGLTPLGLKMEKGLLHYYGKSILPNISYYDERNESRFGYISQAPLKGNTADLLKLAQEGQIDEIYIALPMVARGRINTFLHMMSDTTVDIMIVPDLYSYQLSNLALREVGGVQSFSVFASPFEGLGRVTKRAIDLIVGGAITLCILPVMFLIAVGVKLSSPGPILFKQDRYGLNGARIKVWKFRSMKVMENSDNVIQATKDDPRVTRFGAFIRRTSLDELPQFFNVLQGTMSIVGPRPHAVAHNEEYRKIVSHYMVRHKIKPGITGLAQIKGYRGETDTIDKMAKRVEYDIRYMQNWTPLYDLKIIFLTIFKGFVSDSAY